MQMDFKRGATILEMIMSLVTTLGVIVTAYVALSVTQARQDERIKSLERNYYDINSNLKQLSIDIRELNNKNNEILLELKDKQDRPLK